MAVRQTKKRNTKSGKAHIEQEKKREYQRQIAAIILFATGFLLLFLAAIPGAGVWQIFREILFGIFGVVSYFISLIFFFVGIILSIKYEKINITAKIIEGVFLIILICSAVYVTFTTDGPFDYLGDIKSAFELGEAYDNSGALGAIFGGLFMLIGQRRLIGGLIIGILTAVDLMFLTGLTIASIYLNSKRQADKISEISREKVESYKEKKRVKKQEQANFNPDIPLGPAPEEQKKFEDDKDSQIKKVDRIDEIVKKASAKPLEKEPAISPKPEKVVNSGNYRLPPLSLLKKSAGAKNDSSGVLKNNAQRLVDILQSFGVQTKLLDISVGPSVTRYELSPAAGVRLSKITGLSDDIALNMAVSSVRIEAPIPGKAALGIEIPNNDRVAVTLRELLESPQFKNAKSKTVVALGKNITGDTVFTDISKMPHLLIAGTTGSGKSVALNSMIMTILFNATPDEVKMIMIDPKQVEFSIYNGLPHLMVPVVSDPKQASGSLAWAVKEMLNRYKMFTENKVRDISGYNALAKKDKDLPYMPAIIIVIDELSDLMMVAPTEVEDSICRLAQMARAAGMHMIVATQSPRADVITGLIKANIPSRMALTAASPLESRIILDEGGAEKLIGHGDMLFKPIGKNKPTRLQGCFISDEEIRGVVNFVKEQQSSQYNEEIVEQIKENANNIGLKKSEIVQNGDDSDELFPQAVKVVVERGEASTTLLQRKLKIGYARAARIIDELEEKKIIGAFAGSKPRDVLITPEEWLEMDAMRDDEKAE
ncbi:MAG: DNA translocase FtsK [Clostridia bacterium]|nr:DNA translocase FtsK [Clostridia bacterium]